MDIEKMLKDGKLSLRYHDLGVYWNDDCESWELVSERTGMILGYMDDVELEELVNCLK